MTMPLQKYPEYAGEYTLFVDIVRDPDRSWVEKDDGSLKKVVYYDRYALNDESFSIGKNGCVLVNAFWVASKDGQFTRSNGSDFATRLENGDVNRYTKRKLGFSKKHDLQSILQTANKAEYRKVLRELRHWERDRATLPLSRDLRNRGRFLQDVAYRFRRWFQLRELPVPMSSTDGGIGPGRPQKYPDEAFKVVDEHCKTMKQKDALDKVSGLRGYNRESFEKAYRKHSNKRVKGTAMT